MNGRIAGLRSYALRSRRSSDAEAKQPNGNSLSRTTGEPEVPRVAGCSAPFPFLWENLQDDIVARTEHGL